MKAVLIASMALAAAAGGPGAGSPPGPASLNPAAFSYVLPDKIDWKPGNLAGADTFSLVGDSSKPGFYVMLNRFHPGAFTRPHYHLNDRYIMVMSGVWSMGTGTNWDPEHATISFKAGSFVTHTARQVHYDGARAGSEGAIVLIFGQGPSPRIACDGAGAETGPGPCADARAAAAKP